MYRIGAGDLGQSCFLAFCRSLNPAVLHRGPAKPGPRHHFDYGLVSGACGYAAMPCSFLVLALGALILSSNNRRNWDGVIPFSARNCRLKFDMLLYPTS